MLTYAEKHPKTLHKEVAGCDTPLSPHAWTRHPNGEKMNHKNGKRDSVEVYK